MTIPLDRLAALCTPGMRDDLAMLSPRQRSELRAKIRKAIWSAKNRRNPFTAGRRAQPHPRARYWREYKRRKAKASVASCASAPQPPAPPHGAPGSPRPLSPAPGAGR